MSTCTQAPVSMCISSFATADFFAPPFLPTMTGPSQYGEKGRQIKFVGTAVQRRERVDFLKKRAWARRVSTWIQHNQPVVNERDYEHVVIYDSALSMSGSRPKVAWDPISIPESREEDVIANEPYIIYSSSSSSPTPSTSTLSDKGTSPIAITASSKPSSRRSPRLRRPVSLSSINEDPEED